MLFLRFMILQVLCWGQCTSLHHTTKLPGHKQNSEFEQRVGPPIDQQSTLKPSLEIPDFRQSSGERWIKRILDLLPKSLITRTPWQGEKNGPLGKGESRQFLVRHRRKASFPLHSGERFYVVDDERQHSAGFLKTVPTKSLPTLPLKNVHGIHVDAEKPAAFLPIQKIFADVGVGFQKYLSPDIFQDGIEGNAQSLNVELLTEHGNKLFDTSWIKFDQSNLKLYGFPLKGNQDEHTFVLKATNSKGKTASQRVHVVVFALPPIFNHYVYICTKMSLSDYGGNVERRLRLAKSIGSYVFPGIRTDEIWIWRFENSCIFLTFRNLPRQGKCDFNAIRTIEQKLQTKGKVSKAFQQALKGVTPIISVNITVLNECQRSNETNTDDGLGWLRDVAPVFILIAVVAVPTLISCIVCREVRRRQAMMRQLQDKRMKEDREQMLLQAAEYKHECGFDSESENGDKQSFRPCRQQDEDGKKFFGFSRIADIIIPEVVIDTVKQGTEILNTFLPQEACESAATDAIVAAQRKISAVQSLHPMHKLLDISQEEQAKHHVSMKNENEVQKRVKGILKFLKNPLDITSVVNEYEGRDDAHHEAERERMRQSRLSKKQIETLIPSISSFFSLRENERRRNSIKEVTDNVSASIRSKLESIWNKDTEASGQTALTSALIHEPKRHRPKRFSVVGSRPDDRETECRSANGLGRNPARRTRANSVTYVDDGPAPGKVPCFGARLQMDDPSLEDNATDLLQTGARVRKDSRGTGLLNRVLNSKAVLGVKKKWIESRERSEEGTEMHGPGLVWQNVDSSYPCTNEQTATDFSNSSDMNRCGLRSIHFELGTPAEGRKREGQTWDFNYGACSNPKRRHHNALQENEAESRPSNLHPEIEFSATAVGNQTILENADRCYVNKDEEQVDEYPSMISGADGGPKDLERCSWRHNINEKQSLEVVLPKYCQLSRAGNNIASRSYDQTEVAAPKKGLRHYDPASGKWYPAYSSIKKIIPDSKMFSLLESFKRTEHSGIGRKKTMPNDSSLKGKLQWYNLDTNAEGKKEGDKKEQEKHRRKTGIDITAGLTASKSNPTSIFDQLMGLQCEGQMQIDCNHQNIVMDRFVPGNVSRGIWTERQSRDDDGDEFYQSSDEDLEQRGFIDGFAGEQGYDYIPYDHEQFEFDHYSFPQRSSGERTFEREDLQYTDSYPEDFERREDAMEHSNMATMDWPGHGDLVHGEFDDGRMYQREMEGIEVDDGKGEGDGADGTRNQADLFNFQTRRRSSTDSQLQLSSCHMKAIDSPTKSEPDYSERMKAEGHMKKERRRSFLERQRRVEIPEKPLRPDQKEVAKVHVNPMFVIEERGSKEETDERGVDVVERLDADKGIRLLADRGGTAPGDVRSRKLTYSGPFPTPYVEAERIRKQDEDIIRHQTKGYLERRRQSLQHIAGFHPGAKAACDTEPIPIQSRAPKREEPPKRTGMRRFSTPSMDSWTSTPEKYYYDATGDNSISEEDVDCAGLRKDKEKQPFASGRGRAREYTQRLLQGVSPKIRRHSTTVMGQKSRLSQSGNATSGTFLEKIGERKFVQTIQTKLGKKESKSDEPKSPVFKEKEKFLEEEKTSKGSPLTAIRNTLFLFSGGK